MTEFYLAAGILTLASLAILVYPLLKKSNASANRADYDMNVYRDQLAEVDKDVQRGMLDESQAVSARTEIQHRMLNASEQNESMSSSKGAKVLLLVTLIGVPLGAATMYWSGGTYGIPDMPLASRSDNAVAMNQQREQGMAALARLEAHLVENPGDAEGWAYIIRAYEALNRLEDAIKSYEKLLPLTDYEPRLLAAYGETIVLAENGQVIPLAVKAFKAVLEKEPKDPVSQFYLGLAREQANDAKGAITIWANMLGGAPADAPWADDIRAKIVELSAAAGIQPPAIALVRPAIPQGGPQVGPSADQMRDAANMSQGDQQAMIRGMVERVEERLKENPDVLKDWQTLARVYQVLGQPDKVAEAEANIKRLSQ